MKKKDLLPLQAALIKLSTIRHTKFAYCIVKNLKKVQQETDIIRSLNKVSAEYTEYEKKRIALCELYAEKNDKGVAIIEGSQYKIKSKKRFNTKLKALQEEYKETIKEKEKRDSEMNELLMEEIDIEFHKIKVDSLPDELSGTDLMAIEDLIDAG